ncbi:hypothetical protein CCP2SC5_440020 [Azospirillaceae bacterium]
MDSPAQIRAEIVRQLLSLDDRLPEVEAIDRASILMARLRAAAVAQRRQTECAEVAEIIATAGKRLSPWPTIENRVLSLAGLVRAGLAKPHEARNFAVSFGRFVTDSVETYESMQAATQSAQSALAQNDFTVLNERSITLVNLSNKLNKNQQRIIQALDEAERRFSTENLTTSESIPPKFIQPPPIEPSQPEPAAALPSIAPAQPSNAEINAARLAAQIEKMFSGVLAQDARLLPINGPTRTVRVIELRSDEMKRNLSSTTESDQTVTFYELRVSEAPEINAGDRLQLGHTTLRIRPGYRLMAERGTWIIGATTIIAAVADTSASDKRLDARREETPPKPALIKTVSPLVEEEPPPVIETAPAVVELSPIIDDSTKTLPAVDPLDNEASEARKKFLKSFVGGRRGQK